MKQTSLSSEAAADIQTILAQATIAATQQDWSLVNQCLQKLLVENQNLASERAIELALQVLNKGDFQQQWDVAKILPKLGRCAIAPLINLLEDEDADVDSRWFAGRILSKFDDPAVVISLIGLVQQTEEEELLTMAAWALAKMGDAAIEGLAELLKDESTRLLAVQSLSTIRRSQTITPLLQVVDDSSPQIRAIAIEALGSFHDPRVPPVLIQALQDLTATVRKEAAIALGKRTDLQTELDLVAKLEPLLYDLNLDVCRQAAIALGRMGSDEAATALFPVLQSTPTPKVLKIDVVRALGWIENDLATGYLGQALFTSDGEICQEIIASLGRIRVPTLRIKATRILLDFYQRQEALQQTRTKQMLAVALGELGSSEASESLQKLAQDSQQVVRLHAGAALNKLAAKPAQSQN